MQLLEKLWKMWDRDIQLVTKEKLMNCLSDCNRTRTHNYLVHKQRIWLNGSVFVYELSGCGIESRCSHLNFRFCACFEQGVPWLSGKYRVWIHSKMRTWHDKDLVLFTIRTKLGYNKVFHRISISNRSEETEILMNKHVYLQLSIL